MQLGLAGKHCLAEDRYPWEQRQSSPPDLGVILRLPIAICWVSALDAIPGVRNALRRSCGLRHRLEISIVDDVAFQGSTEAFSTCISSCQKMDKCGMPSK
jgi:hypothetical protein